MRTLVVLGSKPEPALPPREEIQAVACANASGFSARELGLPVPTYTVMSAILISGIASGKQSLEALRGLRTETLHVLPRPRPEGRPIKRFIRGLRSRAMSAERMRRTLAGLDYSWKEFTRRPHAWWMDMVRTACGNDPEVLEAMARKNPSTGTVAVALGLARGEWDRVVVAGFSFELTHAYGENPEIRERGTRLSRHAGTDIAVMRALGRRHSHLWTSEEIVHERTGLPLAPGSTAAGVRGDSAEEEA